MKYLSDEQKRARKLARQKEYYKENREKILSNNRKRYAANKEYESQRSKQYYSDNKEAINEKHEKYREENRENIQARNKKYREENPEVHKAYRENNSETIKEYNRKYYKKNRKKILEQVKHRQQNPETSISISEYQKEYRNNNKAKRAFLNAKRRCKQLAATPDWLTDGHKAQITALYEEAKLLEAETGDKYHIDHIVPLQGEYVSGLNVPWNLQILPAAENIAKSNKYDIE